MVPMNKVKSIGRYLSYELIYHLYRPRLIWYFWFISAATCIGSYQPIIWCIGFAVLSCVLLILSCCASILSPAWLKCIPFCSLIRVAFYKEFVLFEHTIAGLHVVINLHANAGFSTFLIKKIHLPILITSSKLEVLQFLVRQTKWCPSIGNLRN